MFADEIRADRQAIARGLIEAVARIHPATSHALSDAQYRASRDFLAQMRRAGDAARSGLIFTTNYDLLLYWSTMRNRGVLQTRDGFRPEARALIWAEGEEQSVFNLHGALHLFERPDGTIEKVRWDDRPLIEQITALLDRGLLPLFVSEGSSDQKLGRINRSAYLGHALRRFTQACAEEGAVLFVFGSALNDTHINDAIASGRISRIYVSSTAVGRGHPEIAGLEAAWRELRREAQLPDVEIVVFPAAEARAWGG